MKKIIAIFAIAAFFTACKTNLGTGKRNSMVSEMADTPGLHEFRMDGEEQQVIETRGVYDVTSRYAAGQLNNPNRIKISEENDAAETYEPAPAKRKAIVAASNPVRPVNSNNAGVNNTASMPANPPVTNKGNPVDHSYPNEAENTAPEQTPTSAPGNNTSPTANNNNYPVEAESAASTQTAPEKERKEGWSHAAKGTIAGAGSGAILGAIISKKHGKGAIIGGILGAGTGYIFGRAKDKKEGRY